MDVILNWKISSRVESLVDTIAQCRQELVTACVRKHGMHTKLLECNVYASSKVLELLQLSALWTPAQEFDDAELKVPPSRRQKKTTELVANFELFKLHRMEVLGEGCVRVLATFRAPDDSSDQVWYGNVELTK